MPRGGFLHPGKVEPGNVRLAAFAEGLRNKGYTEGRNVSVVVRAADYDAGRTAQFAAELIDSKAGLAARALDGSDEEASSSADVQLDALVALLTDALRASSGHSDALGS